MIVRINNNNPEKAIINHAVEILEQGGVIIAPTETAYGLIADATNKSAVNKIYKIKGRDFKKFLPLIAGSNCQLREFFKLNKKENELLKKYKGLTMVLLFKHLNTKALKHNIYLLPKQETCAVRVSTNEVVRQIAKKLGRPITATSANKAGKKTCYSVEDILKQFLPLRSTLSKVRNTSPYQGEDIRIEDVDLILDAGKLANKKPSTIVKMEDKEIKIVRQGEVKVKL